MNRLHGGALNTLNARKGNKFVRRAGPRREKRGPGGRLLTAEQLTALTTVIRRRNDLPFTTEELLGMGMTRADLAANYVVGVLHRAQVQSKNTGKIVEIWAPTAFVREMREKPVAPAAVSESSPRC